MKITEASFADVPALCALVNSAYRGDTSRKGWTTEADLLDGSRVDEAMLRQYLENPHSTILKCTNEEEQAITGCVYLKEEHDGLYLGMLTVSPELQAKGIGGRLLQAAEERAKAKGCQTVVMTVIASRHELIDWYKRHGYTETGEKRPFPADEKFGKPKMPLQFLILQKNL